MLIETKMELKHIEKNSFTIQSSTGNETLYVYEWKSIKPSKVKHHFIILHDICDHHGRYEELATNLWNNFNSQINITFIDMKGHGLSSGTRSYVENISEYADDLHQVIENDDNYDVKKIIIGQGLGGLISLSYLEKYDKEVSSRIEGVVLSNPLLYLNLELHKVHDKVFRTINKYAGKVRFPYHIDGREMTKDQDRYEAYNSDPLINHYISVSLVEEVLRKSKKLLDYSYYLDIPVLMLLSKNDFLVNWQKSSLFLKGMPKKLASEKIYPHCLHDLFNEKVRDKVYTDIYNWVNDNL